MTRIKIAHKTQQTPPREVLCDLFYCTPMALESWVARRFPGHCFLYTVEG